MKKFIISALVGSALLAGAAFAQSSVQTLRGATVDDPVPVTRNYGQDEKRFPRNYRQQPPLIPHAVDHYLDRDGNQLDTVAGTRWFCSQCHVPQADAPALIDNTFEASN